MAQLSATAKQKMLDAYANATAGDPLVSDHRTWMDQPWVFADRVKRIVAEGPGGMGPERCKYGMHHGSMGGKHIGCPPYLHHHHDIYCAPVTAREMAAARAHGYVHDPTYDPIETPEDFTSNPPGGKVLYIDTETDGYPYHHATYDDFSGAKNLVGEYAKADITWSQASQDKILQDIKFYKAKIANGELQGTPAKLPPLPDDIVGQAIKKNHDALMGEGYTLHAAKGLGKSHYAYLVQAQMAAMINKPESFMVIKDIGP